MLTGFSLSLSLIGMSGSGNGLSGCGFQWICGMDERDANPRVRRVAQVWLKALVKFSITPDVNLKY
jgi:hypothetical protein